MPRKTKAQIEAEEQKMQEERDLFGEASSSEEEEEASTGEDEASTGEDEVSGETGAEDAAEEAEDDVQITEVKSKKNGRKRKRAQKTSKRRSQTEEISRLRAKIKDLHARERKRKEEERRRRSEDRKMKKQARAKRAPNKFIQTREKARPTRAPFSYKRRDKKKPTLYVWQQRPMKNKNLFWCPVAVDEALPEVLKTAGITQDQVEAVMNGEEVEGIITADSEPTVVGGADDEVGGADDGADDEVGDAVGGSADAAATVGDEK